MRYTKAEYEKIINTSIIFEIDKKVDNIRYKNERYNFINILCSYLSTFVLSQNKFCAYGIEIVETADACLKAYNIDSGEFLNYFNFSLKRKIQISRAKNNIDNVRSGIKLSQDDDRAIRKIIAYATAKGLDIYDGKIQEAMTKALSIQKSKIESYIRINSSAVSIRETALNSDGEEISLFDTIESNEKSAIEKIIDFEQAEAVLKNTEILFADCQERQKPLLKKLITANILSELDAIPHLAPKLNSYTFTDDDTLKDYLNFGKIPTQKEIADLFGLSSASVSRTYKNFINKK